MHKTLDLGLDLGRLGSQFGSRLNLFHDFHNSAGNKWISVDLSGSKFLPFSYFT
jgi:hypothetical protein